MCIFIQKNIHLSLWDSHWMIGLLFGSDSGSQVVTYIHLWYPPGNEHISLPVGIFEERYGKMIFPTLPTSMGKCVFLCDVFFPKSWSSHPQKKQNPGKMTDVSKWPLFNLPKKDPDSPLKRVRSYFGDTKTFKTPVDVWCRCTIIGVSPQKRMIVSPQKL